MAIAATTAVDELLTRDNTVRAVEELLPAQRKTYELGLELKLTKREVERIHSLYSKPRNRLLHILISFTNEDDPSWSFIVKALRSPAVDLPDLARTVETAHIRVPNFTEDEEVKKPKGLPGTEAAREDYEEVKLKPLSKLDTVPVSYESVKRDICSFNERFNSMKELTIRGLQRCHVAIATVILTLTNIRTFSDNRIFINEKHKALFQSKDHLELFGSLNFYWNYLAYDLLDHLIKELAKSRKYFGTVASEMTVYKRDIREFMDQTTLELYCQAETFSADDPPAGFRRITVRFDWPKTDTLEKVDQFRRQFALFYNFNICAMILDTCSSEPCVVVWFIHAPLVEVLRKRRALNLFQEFNVIRFEIHNSSEVAMTLPQTIIAPPPSHHTATPASTSSLNKQESIKQGEEDYTFVEKPSGDFFCPVTMGLLLNPHLSSCCGNHLSREAANRLQEKGEPCPLCKDEGWSTVLNKHFQRQVNSLLVFCCHENRGCGWQGEVSTYQSHVKSCPMKDCPLMAELLKLPIYSGEEN